MAPLRAPTSTARQSIIRQIMLRLLQHIGAFHVLVVAHRQAKIGEGFFDVFLHP
jgi:phosphoribosylpyrophosphate synthetase